MYRREVRFIAALAALVAVVTLIAAGCSSDPPEPRWEKVTTGRFTGVETERLDLGTFYLAKEVRVAWDLSGPEDARAEFGLLVRRAPDATSMEGYGTSVRSWKENFSPQADEALVIGVREPDEYAVTLTQRVPQGARGFSGDFTLYTGDLD